MKTKGTVLNRDTHQPKAPRPAQPFIPSNLTEVSNLAAWIEDENDGDTVASHLQVTGDASSYAGFALLELSEARVERCSLIHADFSRALFTDVAFVGCDFSNSEFSEANFTRCTFSSCKFTGADFREAVFSRVEISDSTLSYASFAKAKLGDVGVRSSDASGADIAEARLLRISFDEVKFAGTSFFRTSLDGVDLTTCQLSDIVLSDDMGELRGCLMDLYQAAGIAQRMGVVIKD